MPIRSIRIARVALAAVLLTVVTACAAPARAERTARRAAADIPATNPTALTVRWGAPTPFAPTLVAADDRGAVVVGSLGAIAFDANGARQWHARVTNVGLEVPALDARTVALVERVGDDPHTGALVVLDRATGTQRWAHALGAPPGPVAIDAGTVFVSTEHPDGMRGTLHSFDARTGASRWTADLPGRVPRRATIVVDRATGTLATVLDAAGRWVLALYDAATGAERGGLDLGTAGAPSAAALAGPGWAVVGDGSTGEVLGLDLAARAVGWVQRLRVTFDPSSPPAVAGHQVVVADGFGGVHALDAATGSLRWSHSQSAAVLATRPVVAGGIVALADWSGTVRAWDLATGAPVTLPAPGGTATGLAATRDTLLVALRLADPDRLEAWRPGTAPKAPGPPGGP